MFGVIKKLFGKPDSEKPSTPVPSLPDTKPRFNRGVVPQGTPAVAHPAHPPRLVAPAAPAAVRASVSPPDAAAGDVVILSFASIIKQVPQELWGQLAPAGVAGLDFPVARQQVLGQLAQGAVKVMFGELRQRVPKGVFIDSAAHDHELICLPLGDVLAQLHPDAYARRSNQTALVVPSEIADVFGPRGEGASALRVADKPSPPAATAVAPAPHPVVAPEPVAPAPVPRATSTATPAVPRPVSNPVTPASVVSPAPATAEAAPVVAEKTILFPGLPRPESTAPAPGVSAAPKAASAPVVRPVASVQKPVAPLPKPAPSLPKAAPLPKPSSTSSAPVAGAPASLTQAAVESGTLLVALADLADEWPDGIRQEIAQLKSPNPQVALPLADVGQALKRGRVEYSWKQLRVWLSPAQFFDTPSPYGDVMLELPAKIITPLYIDKTHGTSFFKKQSYADKIPDLLAQAEPPGSRPAPPVAPAAPVAAAPRPVPPSPRPPAADTLIVEIKAVWGGWPQAVRQEVAALQLESAQLEIPFAVLERDLRSGRLSYPWADILAWSNPPAPGIHTSPNAETPLDLPLHIVAPLFIQQRPQGLRKKAAVPGDIPDVFSGPPPAAAPEPGPVAAVPHAPVSVAPAVVAPAPAPAAPRLPQTLGELFGIPQKQNWTPNELVQKAACLPGLAGALIALQDGFLVAAHLPASWKADTVSAFLPQIFGRMNQYCREIGIGEPRAITFTLEEGTLQIYRAGIIFLAVLVKPGTTVPEGAIALITAELGRHTR